MNDENRTEETPSEHELIAERKAKLARLREAGIEPFPHEFPGVVPSEEVRDNHQGLEPGEETNVTYRVAGRLSGRRGHGKAAFLDVVDRSGKMQVHARADLLGEESFEQLVSLDLGDLVGIDGDAFVTKRGELSLAATGWTLLAKSLRPPPDKHHGLADVETRYRHRELDLIANEDARELFILRSKVISLVRRWLDDRGFLEVETPVLQPIYGGALARPFTTHHNALDREFYLRIATELYLKRLIVGGLEKVYELGKDFRNEGVSHKHNPEFTMIETYEAYVDYEHVMDMVETARVLACERGRLRRRAQVRGAMAADPAQRGDQERDRPRHLGTARARGACGGDGREGLPQRAARRLLAAAGRRTAQQARRAQAQAPDLHHRLSRRALTVRQGAPQQARPGRALRGLRRGHGVRQRLLAS